MDIQKKIKRLDDEHIAFRKKVSETVPSYELSQIEENREIFERKIQRYEERLNKTYHEENRIYNKKLEELEKEKKNS